MALRIKARHAVKPAISTWNGTLPLSQLDQIGVITHTPLIYIYNKPSPNCSSHDEIIEALKESLSRVLVPFYPLAGRLHWIGGGRLELHCNALGVELIEAESSQEIIELGDLFSNFEGFEDLVPHVDYEKPFGEIPVFLVQLTWFRCGGIGLSTNMSHAVTDGLGAFNFIREWANLARGEPLRGSPYLDRQILDDGGKTLVEELPYVDHVSSFPTLPTLIGKADSFEKRTKETIATTLLLTKSQVDKLRKAANREIQHDCDQECPHSRFEAVAAHIWRCTSKARQHRSEQMTALSFYVDSRRRMDPPLPPRYFGNAVVNVIASSQAGELISRSLSHACRKIREATNSVTNEYIRSMIDFLKEQKSLSTYQDRTALGNTKGIFHGNPNLGVASWLNLPVRGLDFGWGEEIYMGPGSHDFNEDGDVMILPGYNNDGSVVVVVLTEEENQIMGGKIKACYVVKPAEPTWTGIQSLSELDQIGVIKHIPTIYFYDNVAIKDWLSPPNKIICTLKDSLSCVLVPFYPLAGRLCGCNAKGVELIEAESCQVGELMSIPLSHASQKIREEDKKVTGDNISSMIEFLEPQSSALFSFHQRNPSKEEKADRRTIRFLSSPSGMHHHRHQSICATEIEKHQTKTCCKVKVNATFNWTI
ncbi:hypothetical protein Cgig2_011446 [Carnegiea gigantea]|uniref:Uncharacterized protein n=1 Tax=Carnegiea gigantea TaxID=171969 RepID=A0A9Q1KTJ9_9CARY|nr:hypothetical protein Cgig2_011446 [Carnegiea gigantea]